MNAVFQRSMGLSIMLTIAMNLMFISIMAGMPTIVSMAVYSAG